MEQPILKSSAMSTSARNSGIETIEVVIVAGNFGLAGIQIIKKCAKTPPTFGLDRVRDIFPPVGQGFNCMGYTTGKSLSAAMEREGYEFEMKGFPYPFHIRPQAMMNRIGHFSGNCSTGSSSFPRGPDPKIKLKSGPLYC